MSEKILVTGFDRFGTFKRPNRSSEIALPILEEKYASLVETLILPTSRDIAGKQLIAVIAELEPAAVVMFCISAGSKVRLETVAKNRKFNILFPDNEGNRSVGKINRQGPLSYKSTLPLAELYTRLDSNAVPVKMSQDAGTFICNEVEYFALEYAASRMDKVLPTGFVHFGNGLSDALVANAAILVVDTIVDHLNS